MEITDENMLVASLSEVVAQECGIYPDVAKRIRTAAALHDIGKIRIPDNILNKKGQLTQEEFRVMKTHTEHGAKMLKSMQGELGVMARTICMYHHEWWNSTGSYYGKYSCDLPAYVPIVSIADVFVALLSVRSYKIAWPPDEAIEHIRKHSGTQFSPVLVEIFIPIVQNSKNLQAIFAN